LPQKENLSAGECMQSRNSECSCIRLERTREESSKHTHMRERETMETFIG
jgi:hypothetical protein